MADVAQLVERRFVVPVVAGSIPVVRPISLTIVGLSILMVVLDPAIRAFTVHAFTVHAVS